MRNRLFPLAVSEKKHNFVAVKQLKYTIMARLDEWIVFLKMGEIACKATASFGSSQLLGFRQTF